MLHDKFLNVINTDVLAGGTITNYDDIIKNVDMDFFISLKKHLNPKYFLENKLINNYVGDIEISDALTPQQKTWLIEDQIPVILVCLSGVDAKQFTEKELSVFYPPSKIIEYINFVDSEQIELKRAFSDKNFRARFLQDVKFFFKQIIITLNQESILEGEFFMENIRPLPAYVFPIVQKRLGIVSLHEDNLECKHQLQQLRIPSLGLIDKLPKRILPTTTFYELTLYLEKRKYTPPFLLEFRNFVWDTHLRTPKELQHYENSPIYHDWTAFELMQQVICLQLLNWKQIWMEMRWPATREIQRRLAALKYKEWHPPVREYLNYVLSA